jgi:hypothetical protein
MEVGIGSFHTGSGSKIKSYKNDKRVSKMTGGQAKLCE